MRYTRKSCPHCGTSYSFDQGDTYTYGSPIRICQFCHRTFIDNDYIEIAISGVRWVDKLKISPQALFILFGGSIITFCGFATNEEMFLIFGIPMLLFSVCNIISEYRNHSKRIKFLEDEAAKSEQRLTNPDYALALKNLGYKVPGKFLPQTTEIQIITNNKTPKAIHHEEKPTVYIVGKNIDKGVYTVFRHQPKDGLIKIYEKNEHTKSILIDHAKDVKFKNGMELRLYNCYIKGDKQ
jgi:hypothetical protein